VSFVLALDQGTTSSRALIVNGGGEIVAFAQREFPQHFPQPGWVEHDPAEIWSSQAATIADVLTQARVAPRELAAVGLTNQRETTLLWERATGEPVARAIVWQDRRTADLCAKLKARGCEAEVTERTGLLLDPYFSGTKLAWLLDHIPGARQRALRGELAFGTVDSWLAWKLSGGAAHVTDATNASRTLLVNLRTGDWDETLLSLFDIPRACLPRIVPSLNPDGVPISILGQPLALTGIAGDQQAALFGQACFTPGMAKNTYGTGCFMLLYTGSEPITSAHRLLTTIAWRDTGLHYALEGSVFNAGAVVQWLRDELRLVSRAEDIEALAASVPDSGGVTFVPAFTGLGSPHWDPQARGLIIGLTRGTGAAHLARAALESIAFQSAELLGAMQTDGRRALTELRVDGGASSNNLLMQIQSDLLGVPVVRPRLTQTTALGAAYLAGLAVGVWSSTEQISQQWRIERRFEPSIGRDEAAARLHRWSRAVGRARGWEEA